MTGPVFNSCRQVFLSALQQSFPSSAPIRQKREIITYTDPTSGTVTYEEWWKDGMETAAPAPAAKPAPAPGQLSSFVS
jgi:hypothetical protein